MNPLLFNSLIQRDFTVIPPRLLACLFTMMISFLHCACFFFIICLSADSAKALAFPLTLKDTSFHTLDASARGTSLTELAILFTFTMGK